MTTTLILGAPGTGKTETLIRQCQAWIKSGVNPAQIAFVSFTKAAVAEAHSRMPRGKYPWFRTIHSLAFNLIGAHRTDMISKLNLEELSLLTGETFTGRQVDYDGPLPPEVTGDHLLHLHQLARAIESGLDATWQRHTENIDWHRFKRFADTYDQFKRDRSLLDFTDLLERYAAGAIAAPVTHAIIDEAQDLTALQWDCIRRAFSSATDTIIAGDDDQCIHQWAGAADEHFRTLPYPQTVLPKSHRLPRAIHAHSQRIISRVRQRFAKRFSPAEREGAVRYLFNINDAPLETGEWLLLARSRWLCTVMAKECHARGLLYTLNGRSSVNSDDLAAIREHGGADWHVMLTSIPVDRREYYLTARRNGERLLHKPRIRIETIHGAKGMEAPNVLLMADLPRRAERAAQLEPDAEARVWYVGATRASESLYILEAANGRGYAI